MAKINTQAEFKIIEHPKFKELKVNARVLDPIEHMDMTSRFQQYQRAIAVTHPETGELIKDEDGDIITRTTMSLPAKAVIQILADTLEGWEGLEDENGKAIPFHVDNIKFLFAKGLNVKVPVQKKFVENGKTVEREVPTVMSFADYIQKVLNDDAKKELEEENSDSPKSKSSKKPS
jgi:hypothetical protein